MANYELPQVRVFQDLEPSIEISERAMLPAIIGQRRDIFEYNKDAEDSDLTGLVGSYSMREDLYANWANLGPSSTVIENSVRVYGEDIKVSIVKAGYLDDVHTLSPLHADFGDLIDNEKFFTPLVDGQENAFVFATVSDGELTSSVNLSGNLLYRTPQVGDFIKVRQTSADSAQSEDWSAQVIGLIETESNRTAVATPEEDAEVNTFDNIKVGSTVTVSNSVAGDTRLGVDYKVVTLQDIAVDNDESHLAGLYETALNKACESGIFDLGDLGYNIRVHNISEEEVELSIQTNEKTTLVTVSLDKFLLTADNLNTYSWFDEVVGVKGSLVPGAAEPDPGTEIGGYIVDDLFLVYAVPKADALTINNVERTDNVVTLDVVSNSGDLVYAAGDYILISGLSNSSLNGYARLTSATSGTSLVFEKSGADITSVADSGSCVIAPVKNDSFSLDGSLEKPAQDYSGSGTSVPELITAEYDWTKDTIYTVEVIEGGAWQVSSSGDDNFIPSISLRITDSNGVDQTKVVRPSIDWDPETDTGSGDTNNISVGTKGIEIKFNKTPSVYSFFDLIAFSKGDVWTIAATGRSGDAVVGVITDKNFSYFESDEDTQRLDIEFMEELEGQIEIPKVQLDSVENWEINPETSPDGQTYDLKINALAQVPVSDLDAELNISDGNIYMSYEAVNNSNTGSIIVAVDPSDPDDELGPDDPRNPLGYGVRKAMLNSRGAPVLAVSVDEMDDSSVDDALALLSNNNNAYQITPMTFDESIQNKVVAHVLAMSTEQMDLWRRAYISTEVGDEYGLLTVDANNDPIYATFEANDGDTAYNKLVLDSGVVGVSFLDSNVKAGHTVRYGFGTDMYGNDTYSEFTVLSVLNATELLVLGDYGHASSTIQVQVFKDTSAEDVIYVVGNRSEGLNSRRVTNVFPSVLVDDNDVAVPGYFAAAALAGLAAGSEPHQGHTNSKLLGFKEASTLAPMRRMTVVDLNNLAGMGVTIITGEASDIGVRHELTTAMIDRKNRETMVTRNLDSLSYAYFDALSPFIGIANVTPEFIQKIKTELISISNYLISSTRRPLIGSQMTSYVINSVTQDPVLADKVNVYVSPELPLPFNYGDIHLQI